MTTQSSSEPPGATTASPTARTSPPDTITTDGLNEIKPEPLSGPGPDSFDKLALVASPTALSDNGNPLHDDAENKDDDDDEDETAPQDRLFEDALERHLNHLLMFAAAVQGVQEENQNDLWLTGALNQLADGLGELAGLSESIGHELPWALTEQTDAGGNPIDTMHEWAKALLDKNANIAGRLQGIGALRDELRKMQQDADVGAPTAVNAMPVGIANGDTTDRHDG
ncbi:uncharacterized protein EV422DRAFT_563760 [Fimicolochytrium jonesii]|uniref:uncharacterized protein n=1 Tax=Fimicolochytrium jonesii TaxID=1396493 RepID=UPI0022FE7B88|nr:uncharacterized protein EV422DRAFT_563760 [Fimicolochytrium jonesii]KAI8825943.1 hypothetical protein EV422DRAFT_563760 [Fimicolochytrium jonesii]